MSDAALAIIDDALIRRVRDRVVEACHPQAIYLFGSAAQGEARAGSDLDLLVVIELGDNVTPHQKASELHALFRGWRIPLDILVRTPAEALNPFAVHVRYPSTEIQPDEDDATTALRHAETVRDHVHALRSL